MQLTYISYFSNLATGTERNSDGILVHLLIFTELWPTEIRNAGGIEANTVQFRLTRNGKRKP